MGLSNANNIIIINKYFKKRVGAAYGLLLTGFGLGGLAMPQVYQRCHL
jgi:peroxiredoxin